MAKDLNGVNTSVFEQGRVYSHQILRVTNERGRKFPKPGNPQITNHVYDIYTKDPKTGELFRAEYLSETEEQHAFFPTEEDKVMYFRCSRQSSVCDEIEPYDLAEELNKMPISTINQSIAGTTYSAAMLMAKDLFAAKIQCNPDMEIDDDLLDKLCTTADKIDIWFKTKRLGM